MARSPWNFLARLTGRGRKTQENSINEGNAVESDSDDNQDQILLIPPAEPETSTTEPGLASDRTMGDSSAADDDPTPTTTILAEQEHDGLGLQVPTVSSLVNQENGISPKSSGKPTGSAARPARQAAVTKSSAERAFTPPAASDELLVLDREIQELRRQLSDKLRSKNAQLKKMLDRFNR